MISNLMYSMQNVIFYILHWKIMHFTHWIISGWLYLLVFVFLCSYSERLSVNPDRGYRPVRTYGQTLIWDISCTEQNHSTICYVRLLLELHVFTAPIHEIMTKYGLSLRYVYIYAFGISTNKIITASTVDV